MKSIPLFVFALLTPAVAFGQALVSVPGWEFIELSEDGMTDARVAEAAVARAPAIASGEAATLGLHGMRAETMVGAFPNLTFDASYTRLSRIDTAPIDFGGATIDNLFETPLDRVAFRATLRFPVTQAILSVLPGLEAADHTIRASELRTHLSRRQVDLESRMAFFDYVRARAQESVAEGALEQLGALRSDVSALIERELRPSADLAEIDASLAQATLELTRVRGSIELARRSLERVSGLEIPVGVPVGVASFRPLTVQTTDAVEAFRIALDGRPELATIHESRAALEARIRANRSRRYPSLDLVGAADLSNPNDRYQPAESVFNESWSVMVAASWSPNSFRAAQFADDQLEAELAGLEANLSAIEDQLFIEVNDALLSISVADQAIEAAVAGVDAARVAHDAAIARNHAGIGTAREVLDAEIARRRAESAVVDARLQRCVAIVRLQWSLGQPL